MAPVDEFIMEVRDGHSGVAVGVHGNLDGSTGPRLTVMLEMLAVQGHTAIVVELGFLRSMDGRGLAALGAVTERLGTRGVTVTMRGAPPIARHTDELARSTEEVANHDELADLAPQVTPHPSIVDAALLMVTRLTVAALAHADGVSVTLERDGTLTTVAASDDAVLQMDRHQYATGEGPCLAAKAHGEVFYAASLSDETRWSTFVPLALEQGIKSILSSPLMAHDRPLGALNIYSRRDRAFDDREWALAELFADQASDVLTRADVSDAEQEQRKRRWSDALTSRETIAQAQGVVMQHRHVSAPEAIGIIRQSARTAELTVLQLATQLLAPYSVDADDLPYP